MNPKPIAPEHFQQAQAILTHPLMKTFKLHEKAGLIEDGVFYLWDGTRCRADWVGEDLIEYIMMVRGMNDPLETRAYLDILAKLVDEPIIVLEAGAGGGQFSLHALRYHPNARAVLVEAHPRHYMVTCDHMRLNNVTDRSEVIYAAVAAEEGKLIRFRSDAGYGSFVDPAGDIWVPTVSVASLMRDLEISYLDILHMDVQGAEIDVLQGAKQWLAKFRIGYLFIGTHTEQLHEECKQILNTHGYVLVIDVSPANSAIGNDGFILARSPINSIHKANAKFRNSPLKRYRRAIIRRLTRLSRTITRYLEVMANNQ
jgi:FkbM family methyltransferase